MNGGPALKVAIAAALFAPCAGLAQSPDLVDRDLFRNRFTVGVIGELAWQGGEDNAAIELYLSDRMRASLLTKPNLRIDARFNGRMGIRLLDGGRLDRVRITDLATRFRGNQWTVDAGRFPVEMGGYRLVDGAQFLHSLPHGFEIGAWAGLAPDPYTTAPALRFGGGPILRYNHRFFRVGLLGEVLSTAAGLDRVSWVVDTHMELGDWIELTARADLQWSPDRGVTPADAGLILRTLPHPDVRLDASYNVWSSIDYIRTEASDPGLTRFDARSNAIEPTGDNATSELDPTIYQMAGLSARYRPELLFGAHLQLSGLARYRHHPQLDRRYGRGNLGVGLLGLWGGRIDLSVTENVYWIQEQLGAETTFQVFVTPDPQMLVGIDASLSWGQRPLPDTTIWVPSIYADLFLDFTLPQGFLLSAGYSFMDDLAEDRWDPAHAMILQATWRTRVRRKEAR